MNPNIVRRRFEVHSSGSIDDVEQALQQAVKHLPLAAQQDLKRLVIDKFEAAKTVSVCVEATPAVAAKLRESIAGRGDVSRDFIEVPDPDVPDPEQRPYPDKRSLARIDPGGLSLRPAGLRAGENARRGVIP